jgi:uncharacterized protein (DUF4213/DUF364 family)
MKLLKEIISTIDLKLPVKQIHSGKKQCAVCTRSWGMASSGVRIDASSEEVSELEHFKGVEAESLVKEVFQSRPVFAPEAVACINSLLEPDWNEMVEMDAAHHLMEAGAGRRIAVVGHFPFIPRLKQVAQKLWVLEQKPKDGDLPASQFEEILPCADVIAITGTSFINGTIDSLLESCKRDAFVMILGASAPFSPVLFDYGVDMISGIQVVEPDEVINQVQMGVPFKGYKGIRKLCWKA